MALSACAGLAELNRKAAEPEVAEAALNQIAEGQEKVKVSTSPLALPDALRLAVLTSPRIQTSSFNFAVAGNSVLIARSQFFPELYYQISASSDEDITAVAQAGLRYTLYDFGERSAKTSAALWKRRGASLSIIQLIDEVSLDAVEAYVGLAAAEQSLDIANRLISDLTEERRLVASRVDSGAANESELQSVNVAIIRAEAGKIEAQAQVESARISLQTQTGVPFQSVAGLNAIEKLIPTSVAALDVDRSPLVMFRQAEQKEMEQELIAARASRFPRIGVKAGVSSNFGDDGEFSKPGVSVGPEISNVVPLGKGRKLAVRNAELAVHAATSNVAVAKRDVRMTEQDRRLQLGALIENLARRHEVLSASEELTRLRRVEYEAGNASISDIIEAIEAEAAARAAVVSTHASLLITRINLQLTTGQLQQLFFYGKDVRFERSESVGN